MIFFVTQLKSPNMRGHMEEILFGPDIEKISRR